jgi:uncharacterized membrane protein YphA (DoxX/SURF4 family)
MANDNAGGIDADRQIEPAADRPRIAGRPWQLWASTLARLILAGVLAVAGGLKVTQPLQAAMAVQAYEIFPPTLGQFLGYALPLFELALALLLLLGIAPRMTAITVGLLMAAFVVGIASAWARGLNIDCGCFGSGGQLAAGESPTYLPEILRDLLFLGLASWLAVFPASRWALDKAGTTGTPRGDQEGLLEELGAYAGDDGDLLDPADGEGEPGTASDPSDPRTVSSVDSTAESRPGPEPDHEEPVR